MGTYSALTPEKSALNAHFDEIFVNLRGNHKNRSVMESKSFYEPPRMQLIELVAESAVLTASTNLEDPVVPQDELDW